MPGGQILTSGGGKRAQTSSTVSENREVSSANWLILMCSPLISMPLILGSFWIRRVSASAIIKKARGDRGHPWGTPHLIEKGWRVRRQ
eukprot:scaffold985_cov164-Isochrysis_galbana.AAC.2